MNEKDLIARISVGAGVRFLLLLTLAAGLTACGGGDGVDIGGGQQPDPVVVDVPIAYVKRPLPLDDNGLFIEPDLTNLDVALPGADLFVRDRASVSAAEKNITGELTQGLADIRDLSSSYDGSKVLFSMRMPIEDPNDLPPWNIWEYEFETGVLRSVVSVASDPDAGEDRFPQYLPDGRIVFSSTRQIQTGEVLVDEGRGQFAALEESRNEEAMVLHVMDADGNNIHQISFNQSHDLYPSVLATGEIIFSRWDQAVGNNELNIYTVRPDGTRMQLLYGANSHNTGTDGGLVEFVRPRQDEQGNIISLLMPSIGTQGGGQMVSIDVRNYVENTQALGANFGILTGPAQVPVTDTDVSTEATGSVGGRYAAATPLWDGTQRVFVSWAPCVVLFDGAPTGCTNANLLDPEAELLEPAYGIWLYDQSENTQPVVVAPEAGVWITDIAVGQERVVPWTWFDEVGPTSPYPDLAAEGWGLLNIRSVYDVDGVDQVDPANQFSISEPNCPEVNPLLSIEVLAHGGCAIADDRPARFVRIVKAASIPDDEIIDTPRFAFGVSTLRGMREIIGYAPVEPDGSVRVRVPANVPLAVQVLDKQGRMLPLSDHFNWLQVMPGTETKCNGCHSPFSGLSHGRETAFDSAYAGALTTQFPGSVDTWVALAGETMAEARSRESCALDDCAEIIATTDVVYEDVWTDPVVRAIDDPFSYLYADLDTPAPITGACAVEWTAACRIVINYETHIHPLWSLPRVGVDDSDLAADRQCIACHTTTVDLGGTAYDAAAFLDLTGDVANPATNRFPAYEELLAGDNELIDNGSGVLIDRVDDLGPDINGVPQFQFYPVSNSMVRGRAINSRFFGKFYAGGTHEGWLSDAELKLLAEWVDIGAQYYNSFFEIPGN